MEANHQRIGKDRGAEQASLCLRVRSRRASSPSVVEHARRICRRGPPRLCLLALCFLGGYWAAISYAESTRFGLLGTPARPRPTVGSPQGFVEMNLPPEAQVARQACRAAAGFNDRVERTAAMRLDLIVDGWQTAVVAVASALPAAVADPCLWRK
jgi:hypothetical protein